ncbi:sarcosine oxidase subunit delta [Bradyrhizobium japonicum]|uniref:sarcosine oxidase subunit delta n=1 Tax=Bradyrhizobium japonicum TaxID=375 RepID=UPI0009B8B6E0|nr:sarcosine oxidase subunit delta [Bradyrhizobium japonicum]
MRIACPHCGLRDVQEFIYHGDATLQRPDGLTATEAAMFEYVYVRDNPRGPHEELWYHGSCRTWLIVRRDTVTHAIESVMLAKNAKVGRAA